MANNLGNVVLKYTTLLDEIVEQETLTSDLNMNQELLGEFRGNGKIELPKLTMDGLGNYSRTDGFNTGAMTLEWEERTLAYDRGREFKIDDMDDEERLSIITMNAMAQFARTKVIPEVDAIRFARLATAAGTKVSKTFSDDSTGVSDAKAAVLAAETVIEDKGVYLSNCVIYMTSFFKKLLKQALPHSWGNESGPSHNFETFDEMKVVVVPQSRFYSEITVNDGTTAGQTAGGYAKASGGKDINFLVVNPEAAAAIQKHEKLRYFAPDVYQGGDMHDWQYRLYHDLLTFDNKNCLIYCSKKA